jgi:chorismate mutase
MVVDGGPSTDGVSQAGESERLEALRKRIMEVDEALVDLIEERKALVLAVGRLKAAAGLPVLDPSREAAVVRRAAEMARARGRGG